MPPESHAKHVYEGHAGPVQAFLAHPQTDAPRPAVLVIHEIWGLTPHIQDVAARFARQGYVALAPDLYSRPDLSGALTPEGIGEALRFNAGLQRERMSDPAYLPGELAKLPAEKRGAVEQVYALLWAPDARQKFTLDLVKAVEHLQAQPFVQAGKVASVGFCFGGGLSVNLACHAPLSAAVIFYGENPTPIEKVANITCPVLGLYGADDARINIRIDELVRAMVQYRKDFEMKIYTGAAHAFFNDSNPNSYRPVPAADAWERTLGFFEASFH